MNQEFLIFEIPLTEPGQESPYRVGVAGKLYSAMSALLVTFGRAASEEWQGHEMQG